MLKFPKIIFLSTLVSLPITTCFFFASCSSIPPDDSDYKTEHADFINERSFSIYASSGLVGTTWIFKKSQDSDYSYYLATNVHVASLFSRTTSIKMYLGYNPDYSKQTWFDSLSDYYPIDNYDLIGENSDERPTKPEWSVSSPYEWDVDFDVFKVNFGTVEQIKDNDPFKTSKNNLLNRLNNLNNYANLHSDSIVEFADSNYQYELNMPIHVAGFPKRQKGASGSARWTSYSTTYAGYNFSNNTSNNPIFAQDQDIYFKDNVKINIIGKVIAYKSNDTPELTGGSSGSMVVDDDDKVIAINFAGSTKKDDEYTSMQSVGLFLNTKNSYFGSSYQYEVLTDWFNNLT